MKYEFPYISHIDDVLPHIDGVDEFIIADKGNHKIMNYLVQMSETFPTPENQDDYAALVRRECRGIIFGPSGEIVRRSYHKFFNYGEREETQNIDFDQPHTILTKLDGSMIAPFMIDNEIIWGTKMGDTDVAKPVQKFVSRRKKYIYFARHCISMGVTPIFEWCSRKQKIVIDYPEDMLVLCALRNMKDGEYCPYDILKNVTNNWDIPVVNAHSHEMPMKDWISSVSDMTGIEGFIVRFNDGHMIKIKTQEYIKIHRAKDAISLDRNVVLLILENAIDDVKPSLPKDLLEKLEVFEDDVHYKLQKVKNNVIAILYDHNDLDRGEFARTIAPKLDPLTRSLAFKLMDKGLNNCMELIIEFAKNKCTNTKSYDILKSTWLEDITFNEE